MNWVEISALEQIVFVFHHIWEVKAGNATLKIEDVERANRISPLGNANRRFSS